MQLDDVVWMKFSSSLSRKFLVLALQKQSLAGVRQTATSLGGQKRDEYTKKLFLIIESLPALRGVTFANPNANPARHRETEGEAEKDEITRPLDLLEQHNSPERGEETRSTCDHRERHSETERTVCDEPRGLGHTPGEHESS